MPRMHARRSHETRVRLHQALRVRGNVPLHPMLQTGRTMTPGRSITEATEDFFAHHKACKHGCGPNTYCVDGFNLYQRALRVANNERRQQRTSDEQARADAVVEAYYPQGPCMLCGAYDGDHEEGCPCAQ